MSGIDLAMWVWYGYIVFAGLCFAAGVLLAVALLFHLVKLAGDRVLCVATLMEALIEARRQGRAPILRAWKWWGEG